MALLLEEHAWEVSFCFFRFKAIQEFIEVRNFELEPVRYSVEIAVKELEAKKIQELQEVLLVFLFCFELLSIESCVTQLIDLFKVKESKIFNACELES